jgi:hypothetical protein
MLKSWGKKIARNQTTLFGWYWYCSYWSEKNAWVKLTKMQLLEQEECACDAGESTGEKEKSI